MKERHAGSGGAARLPSCWEREAENWKFKVCQGCREISRQPQALSETVSYKKEHGEELRGVVAQWGLRACRALAKLWVESSVPQKKERKGGKEGGQQRGGGERPLCPRGGA